MGRQIEFLPLDTAEWMEFIQWHPLACIFHHPAWAQVLAEQYGMEALLACERTSQGRINAGIPLLKRRGVLGGEYWTALPYTDHCQPLALMDEDAISLSLELSRMVAERGVRLQIRSSVLDGQLPFKGDEYILHQIRLEGGMNTIRSRYSAMHRRNIHKAQKLAVVIETSTSVSAMNTYYHLHCKTRRRLGVPPQPRRFFTLLHQRLIAADLGFILLAHVGDRAAAGAIFLHWNRTMTYKYGASEADLLRYRPNDALFDQAIQIAVDRGIRVLDLGRSLLQQTGLCEFKAGWGAVPETLIYAQNYPNQKRSWNRGIWRGIESMLRHAPLWVSRGLGEVFYRYAGG